ncbi:immunity 49 family protein [Nocardia sp. NPDC058497]|uniref:immunity 49 family protein n=1 Tax=Nocardia sp. NPDC058497 TaxID=3346529 RepID=UPI003659B94D
METIPVHWTALSAPSAYLIRIQESTSDALSRMTEHPRAITTAFERAAKKVREQLTLDPTGRKLESWEAAVLVLQTGSAMFEWAYTTDDAIDVMIDHEVRHLSTLKDNVAARRSWGSSSHKWLTTFWWCLICRDGPRLEQLANIPAENLFPPHVQTDEYWIRWTEALQIWALKQPGLVDKLGDAIQLSDPSIAVITPRDMLDKINYQYIYLFYRVLQGDPDEFNTALQQALHYHREYWTSDPDREDDFTGNLALGLLAIACLALDSGIPVNVQSDYLPEHLLRGSWLGEFPI